MPRATLTTTADARRFARPRRRGISSTVLLVAWSVIVGSLALAVDSALVFYQGRQLQTACESASLAAAVELMDPAALTPEGLRLWLATGGLEIVAPAQEQLLHASAREQAVRFAAANVAGGERVELAVAADSSNERNEGDIVVGCVADPTAVASPLIPASDQPAQRANSILVRTSKNKSRGNPITLWFGRQIGVEGIDLTASARASLDQRVVGFRPAGHVRVPMVPLVVCEDDTGENHWLKQAMQPIGETTSDAYIIHPATCQMAAGRDSIPEITLTVSLVAATSSGSEQEQAPPAGKAAAAGDTHLVCFGPTAPSSEDYVRQITQGCDLADLAHGGGSISMLGAGASLLPRVEPPSAAATTAVAEALLSMRGEKKVWPLGEITSDGGCVITGFAAGQVVDVRSEQASLLIVVQPCQLITCTAQTGAQGPMNPWIGKLLRTQ